MAWPSEAGVTGENRRIQNHEWLYYDTILSGSNPGGVYALGGAIWSSIIASSAYPVAPFSAVLPGLHPVLCGLCYRWCEIWQGADRRYTTISNSQHGQTLAFSCTLLFQSLLFCGDGGCSDGMKSPYHPAITRAFSFSVGAPTGRGERRLGMDCLDGRSGLSDSAPPAGRGAGSRRLSNAADGWLCVDVLVSWDHP